MKTQDKIHYCNLPQMPARQFRSDMDLGRMEAILVMESKWVNGTTLKYYFFDTNSFFTSVADNFGNESKNMWKGSSGEQESVRKAFAKWKNIGIGLEFEETNNRSEAHIRIGFAKGEGSWSYVGRDSWNIPKDQRTMNFGWDILNDQDTILHEIGHALGLPHEHQNPNAGIIWNEEAVYNSLAESPNFWTRDKTFQNIIRKINPDTVQGSSWDANSIMHYPFGQGMINIPAQFSTGLFPENGLSDRDKTWILKFYPKLDKRTYLDLKPFYSEVISLGNGDQVNFEFVPEETRTYTVQTFGTMDTVMVLSEMVNGVSEYVSGDDDSGEDNNSSLKQKFIKGKKYIIQIRLYYKSTSGDTCVMVW